MKFGRDYLIPFPFDPRVLLWVAPAVAWAAVASGVAGAFIELDAYREQLEARLGRAKGIMRGIINRAVRNPKRLVLPEGEERKMIRAARLILDEGIAQPILLGNQENIRRIAQQDGVHLDDIEIEDPVRSPRLESYAHFLWERRQRKGLSLGEAQRRIANGNYFGNVMVARGDADALLTGMTTHYPETLRPALEVIGANPKAGLVSGMYMLVFEKHVIFCGDTTVNIEPTRRAAGADRICRRAHRARVRPDAQGGDALVLEFRLGAAPRGGATSPRPCALASAARSVAHGRRRDAGRHRDGHAPCLRNRFHSAR